MTDTKSSNKNAYSAMVAVMISLAERDAVHEAAVMRIANAGEVEEVIEFILRMRKWQKKHSKPEQAAQGPRKPRKAKEPKAAQA